MISIYVVQIILILIFGFLFRDNKKQFLIATFVVLFVVMAFRNPRLIGYDSSSSYYYEFTEIQSKEIVWPNPGLSIVMKTIQLLGMDYQWVIIISAIVICFAYYKLLEKYSQNVFISVMWFMGMLFYTFLFSSLKQAWAMAFLCFAFNSIFEKKIIRYLLFIGLATLFHFPALIFLPAYWIAKLKINRTFPILMFSVLGIVFIFRSQILNLMTNAYSQGTEGYESEVSFFGTKFILMLLIIGYAFYRYFKFFKGNEVFGALIYFMGLAAVIQTFCFYNNIFERLADYYYQFSIVFMPLVLLKETSNSGLADNTVNSDFGLGETQTKKRISNITIDDIDINTVLALVITVFCIWRFVSYMVNDAFFSPFYFFWQSGSSAIRYR